MKIRRPNRRTAAAAAIVAALSLPAGAQTQIPCAIGTEITDWLSEAHGEAPVDRGLRGNSLIVEIWTNPASGSWSLVALYADGRACLLGSGQHWEAVEYVATDNGEDM